MRLRRIGCWGSLTCVVSALAFTAGCNGGQGGDENKSPDNGQNYNPDQQGGPNGMYPGNTGMPGMNPGGTPQNGLPTVRKLALDLKGVAGFAILDQDDADASGTMTPSPGGATGSNVRSQVSPTMWLNSNSAGQELRATGVSAKVKVDPTALSKIVLDRQAMGTIARPASSGWAAQEDPGAPAPITGTGTGTGTADTAAEADGETKSAAEQAGLLKITDDGEVVPALVALEETALDNVAGADAGAPSGSGASDAVDAGAAPDPGSSPTGAGGANTGATDPSRPGPLAPPPHFEPLPRVTAVGLSPDGSVYILFERSFFYRQPSAAEMVDGFDPFAPGSPYRCQLFRANGNWQNGDAAQPALAELECVTNQYEIRTWDARRVMQFDASGKLYFRAAAPGTSKEVFYQYNPVNKELSEKVNGNICWRDVQVTPRGSLFYTGTSNANGDCSGTSFFRYVSQDNRLTEIARDWWNFKYVAEQDPEDPTNERIIFYGPDPNATGESGWQTACLYRYNPGLSDAAARTQKLVECVTDPSSYIYGGPNGGQGTVTDEALPAFGERCTSEGQLFVGGEGVTGLSQLQDGTLFVVGSFQKKLPGEVRCGLDVSVDHCSSVNPEHSTQQACETAGFQWHLMGPHCNNPEFTTQETCLYPNQWLGGGGGFDHHEASGAACVNPRQGFQRGYLDCRAPGSSSQQQGPQPPGNLVQKVEGLAYLVPGIDGGLSQLSLLSDPGEVVERYWALEGANGPELYYSVYSGGEYSLRLATQTKDAEENITVERRVILEDFEVYNLQRDPSSAGRIMFDALQFSTNEYLFGSADATLSNPEEIQASVEAVQGVSGRVETLIVLPNF
jgi:hypothetical protein